MYSTPSMVNKTESKMMIPKKEVLLGAGLDADAVEWLVALAVELDDGLVLGITSSAAFNQSFNEWPVSLFFSLERFDEMFCAWLSIAFNNSARSFSSSEIVCAIKIRQYPSQN
ncbi:hypothetical protein [Thiomicrorhabdus sp.]|uniref:hypothetical protein n=1 Tax=Thiomicrorhabdus sp. TaxID=2039724 RepID=UPI00356A1DD4